MKKFLSFVVLIQFFYCGFSQCVTTPLTLGPCGFNDQNFTNQTGANNGTAPNATCGWGSSSSGSSTWVRFTYQGPPSQQYLEGGQAAGGAGNNPAIAIYSNDGCTLLGCSSSNANPGPTETASDGKIDLTTLGLTVGQQYLIRVYNEGNTSNVKNPSIRCVPQAPCGDCFNSPCVIGDINTNFSSSTYGSHSTDCCTFPVSMTGAVTQLNCAGPGQVSVDGNVWYSFTVCANGTVTATISYSGCDNTSGSQIWFLNGNCNGGTANFTNLACANNGTTDPATVSYNCTSGQTYYIMIDSYGGNVCDFNVSLSGPICILENSLVSNFDAEKNQSGGIDLGWTTDNFTGELFLERSYDGVSFELISQNSELNSTKRHRFTDLRYNKNEDVVYYRIAELGMDSKKNYSNVKAVSIASNSFSIYKTDQGIALETNDWLKNVDVKIYNELGQVLNDITLKNIAPGKHTVLNNFIAPNGIYFVVIKSNDEQKIIKLFY